MAIPFITIIFGLMITKACLFCGKPVEQTEGRREKKFCNDSCRQKKWQKDQQVLRAHIKEFGMEQFQGAQSATKTLKVSEISSYDAYKRDIDRAGSIDQIRAIDKEVQRDTGLTRGQKAELQQYGINASKNLEY